MAEIRLSALCEALSGHGVQALHEGEDVAVSGVNTIEDAVAGQLTFVSNPKYADRLPKTKASAVIVNESLPVPANLAAIRSPDPYFALTAAVITIHGYRRHPQWGISEQSEIDPSARVGENANIGPSAVICSGAVVGDNLTMYPNTFVGPGVTIGDDCTLFPGATIYDNCVLGDRVTIHAGSVIGEDGLGYAPLGDSWFKIPQIGHVEVGDDVEIGANCSVDRATLGTTRIGSGTKMGNGNVIGHGSKIGDNCIVVGLVGLAGSTTIGNHVTLAGQCGSAGHLTVGDNARVGGRSVLMRDVPAGEEVLGSPAMPRAQATRVLIATERLPDTMKRIKELERELAALKAKLA